VSAAGEIATVRTRNPTLGAVLYVTALQYFVVQVIVAARFIGGYSLSRNTISDLGNTSCGTVGDRYVCSPAHLAMNLSFVTLGITVVVGSALVHRALGNTRGVATGFALFGVGGVGVVLVGLFPENTVPVLHGIAATLPFFVGGLSLAFLPVLGGLAARAGGASVTVGAIRVLFWGALAMGLTAEAGALFGGTPLEDSQIIASHEPRRFEWSYAVLPKLAQSNVPMPFGLNDLSPGPRACPEKVATFSALTCSNALNLSDTFSITQFSVTGKH